ncbi:MAG: hypothetical protein M0Z76_09885 [Gammaproteobacteria bacterium]|nr:hypothetical protein [Gammaproteobacteria bacterium]
MRGLVWILLLWLLACPPCAAFLGVGDVTFDPAVHAELVTLYEQAVRLYRSTLRQISRLRQIHSALQSAQANVHRVLNTSLLRYTVKTLPVSVPPVLVRLVQTMPQGNAPAHQTLLYFQRQLRRLQRVARLRILKRGVRADVGEAASDLGVRTSGDITAQSTATLAALAAQAARTRAQRALRRAAERRNGSRVSVQTAAIYAALGRP